MKSIAIVILLLIALAVFGVACNVISFGCNYASKAVAVVSNEIDPAVLQKKYEWFKDASAGLDAKNATIKALKKREVNMEADYAGVKRGKWAREDREQWNLWQEEVSGTIGSFNLLCADYNSEMAKWNWRFTNIGQLPAGATTPLPREYKPYAEE